MLLRQMLNVERLGRRIGRTTDKNRIPVSARAKMKAARAQEKQQVTEMDKRKKQALYWMATRQNFVNLLTLLPPNFAH